MQKRAHMLHRPLQPLQLPSHRRTLQLMPLWPEAWTIRRWFQVISKPTQRCLKAILGCCNSDILVNEFKQSSRQPKTAPELLFKLGKHRSLLHIMDKTSLAR